MPKAIRCHRISLDVFIRYHPIVIQDTIIFQLEKSTICPNMYSVSNKIEDCKLEQYRGTTVLSVRRNGKVVIGGDGQVTMGHTIMKGNARKIRRLFDDKVIAGFAGGTADAFTLFELFEKKLEMYHGQLTRAAVELAKDWRTDRMLRRLEALLAVADKKTSLIISGNGDVIEPENNLIAIGSGGPYAQSAARALLENTKLSARKIVEQSLQIAGDICIYTNHNLTIEEL